MVRNQPDPNDFVDADEAFPDHYDADEITHAWFTIVSNGDVANTELVYNASGISFLGGSKDTNWAIGMYSGYRYNGQDIPVHDPDAIEHVLDKLSGSDSISEYDWVGSDFAHFE